MGAMCQKPSILPVIFAKCLLVSWTDSFCSSSELSLHYPASCKTKFIDGILRKQSARLSAVPSGCWERNGNGEEKGSFLERPKESWFLIAQSDQSQFLLWKLNFVKRSLGKLQNIQWISLPLLRTAFSENSKLFSHTAIVAWWKRCKQMNALLKQYS